MKPLILAGNNLETLKELPDGCVDSVVTDPPYGLSFMGKKWDYDVPTVELWREVLRVLKPGGHLLSFGGTRTYHRLVVNIEDAGFEIRDQMQWIYGSGFPKSHNLDGAHKGWGTALKPANEPICFARKPLAPKHTVAQNVQAFGTGALNIDASRIEVAIPVAPNPKFNTTGEIYNMKTGEGRNGTFSRAEGRWPANILFDEEAAAMLDVQAEGVSRFFYCAKASKAERNKGLEGMPEKSSPKFDGGSFVRGGNNTDAKDAKDANFHPTVKPVKLMEYLVRLVTPPGGVCLDPFMGSGTTGVACKNLGFEFIGCEMSPEYLEIAQKRMGVLKSEE